MNYIDVVDENGLSSHFVQMLENNTVTFRGERFVLDTMMRMAPRLDWNRHTFIYGEHNFPLTLALAHVFIHPRDGARGYERCINLDFNRNKED